MSDPLDLLAFVGDDPGAIGLAFQQSVMPRLTEMTDTELFTLAGALLGCGGRTEATYVADIAFRRACGEERHDLEPNAERQPADRGGRAPDQRAQRRAATSVEAAAGALAGPTAAGSADAGTASVTAAAASAEAEDT